MQSAFLLPPKHSALQIPWKVHKTHHKNPKIKQPKSHSLQTNLIPSNFLKPSCGHDFKGVDREVIHLPVTIHRASKVSRYIWDGTNLLLVVSDREGSNQLGFCDGFRRLFRISRDAIGKLFVPQKVRGNYMDYLKWKLLHRIFSSSLQVLATQAMFRAIGIGSSRSLPSAAALNWLLKDGLGRLSRCIYTASLGSAFDTNLKRVRFSTSVLFSLSIGVELLTPTFPQHFLLLATVANIAKSISLAAYLATGSAIHRSFAVADNLGEVSAKSQIQTVCFDIVGLILAAMLNILCKNNQRLQAGLPLLVYPIFSTVDLFAIYQGLKHVHLQTLTKEGILLCLRETAGTKDIIMGLLQACHLRDVLILSTTRWVGITEANNTADSVIREWFGIMDLSKRYAQGVVNPLIEEIQRSGWAAKNVLLNTQEQIRYTLADD
ncbi:protein root UVB sensitive 4-like isoform X2 [Tasmannia lanceolata]|uniref:protein root UVB sensitive 4-like isoform X2 n=1 Tax=Tasmannia lanceolata TaxID=3420 RepID=UPI00406410CE